MYRCWSHEVTHNKLPLLPGDTESWSGKTCYIINWYLFIALKPKWFEIQTRLYPFMSAHKENSPNISVLFWNKNCLVFLLLLLLLSLSLLSYFNSVWNSGGSWYGKSQDTRRKSLSFQCLSFLRRPWTSECSIEQSGYGLRIINHSFWLRAQFHRVA